MKISLECILYLRLIAYQVDISQKHLYCFNIVSIYNNLAEGSFIYICKSLPCLIFGSLEIQPYF